MKKLKYFSLLLLLVVTMSFGKSNVLAATHGTAKIGETEYVTLNDAYDAAKDGDEIVLLRDASGLNNTKKITLNLNDFKITGISNEGDLTIKNGTVHQPGDSNAINNLKNLTLENVTLDAGSGSYTDRFYFIWNNGGTITLKNCRTIEGTPAFTNMPSSYYYIDNINKGKVVVESGTYNLYDGESFILNTETTIINGGTFNVLNTNPIKTSTVIKNIGVATINNGIFKINETTSNYLNNNIITNDEKGTVTIKNGTFELSTTNYGTSSIIIDNSGKAVINGGNIKTTSNYNSMLNIINNKGNIAIDNVTINNGIIDNNGTMTISNSTLSNISNNNYNGKTLTIKSGTFNNVNTSNYGTLNINGGNFTSSTFNTLQSNDKTTINVSGGTFNNESTIFNTNSYGGANISNATLNISGGTFVSKMGIINYTGDESNKVVITGGTFTSRSGNGISISNGSLVIGTNDKKVSKESPVLNIGSIYSFNVKTFDFYDGVLTLNTKIDKEDNYRNITLPTGYVIQYDETEETKVYTAYLVKEDEVKDETSKDETSKDEVKDETSKDETSKDEVKDETSKDETSKDEVKDENKEDVETTVDNPDTGIYASVCVLLALLVAGVAYIKLRNKNYFSKI